MTGAALLVLLRPSELLLTPRASHLLPISSSSTLELHGAAVCPRSLFPSQLLQDSVVDENLFGGASLRHALLAAKAEVRHPAGGATAGAPMPARRPLLPPHNHHPDDATDVRAVEMPRVRREQGQHGGDAEAHALRSSKTRPKRQPSSAPADRARPRPWWCCCGWRDVDQRDCTRTTWNITRVFAPVGH